MPRSGQVKSSADERLSDRIVVGVLTRTFPPELVDEVIAETGCGERRNRVLPARVVVYFVLAMCLFAQEGYEEVTRLLTEGLQWARRWRTRWEVPTTGAISRARARLGARPLQVLFDRVCRPVAGEATPGAWYRGWRLVAMDGTTFDLQDTAANAEHFGRPGSTRGEGTGAYPQTRVVALAECGTHAMFAAAVARLSASENALAGRWFSSLSPGMLLIAERGFPG